VPRNLERFSIVVDANEYSVGHTWIFPGYRISVQPLLRFGCDYSVKGQVGTIGVERKSYNDYVCCLGTDWKRFQKQLAKLRKNRFHTVVVEGNINDPIHERSLMIHEAVLTQTAKVVAMGVPVVFTATRDKAVTFCIKYMKAAINQILDGTV